MGPDFAAKRPRLKPRPPSWAVPTRTSWADTCSWPTAMRGPATAARFGRVRRRSATGSRRGAGGIVRADRDLAGWAHHAAYGSDLGYQQLKICAGDGVCCTGPGVSCAFRPARGTTAMAGRQIG